MTLLLALQAAVKMNDLKGTEITSDPLNFA